MNRPYGGRFAEAAGYVLAGRCAVHATANSLGTPALDYLWNETFPRALGARVRWHYLTVSGQNTATVFHNNLGLATLDSATAIDNLTARTDTRYEKPAASFLSARCMWPCRPQVGNAAIADDSAFGTGIYLSRQIASTPAHTNAQRIAAWPTLPSNGGQPWYHNTDMTAKLIYWTATADQMAGFKIRMLRQGHSANNVGASMVSHTVTAGADRIASTEFATPLADAGTYDVHAAGINNDHDVGLRVFGNGSTTDTKKLIPMAAMFARTVSGTVPSNTDGTRASYFAGGRSGCYVSDWLNYCTQTDWQDWFAAVILDETMPILVEFFDLCHNINVGTGIDVGDGDGAQNEYDSGGAVVNSYWKKRYKALIERKRAAYLAAKPTGIYVPIVVVSNPVKQTCAMDVDTPGLLTSLNSTAKEIAAETNGGWVSLAEYFRGESATWLPVFYNVHPWTPENGRVLAAALMDCIDHATQHRFTPIGRAGGTIIFED